MAAKGTVVINIVGDNSQLNSSLSEAEGKVGAFGSILQGVGQRVGQALSNLPGMALKTVTDSIGKASDLNESLSKVGVVFGDQKDAIVDWSKGSVDAMGISQQKALEATGTFGNLLLSLGQSPGKAADMSKSMVQLASDLGSFNNVPTEDALLAIRSGLTGETEPLKKFGVNMNEATLKAKAMELGLSDGKGVLDANAKAQAAYALILDQTKTAQGDFARTGDGLANSQKKLSAEWENMQATIGAKLMPIMQALVGFVMNDLFPALQNIGDKVKEVSSWFNEHRDVALALGIAIATLLLPTIIALGIAAATTAISFVVAAAPIIAIGVVIAAVALGVIELVKHFDIIQGVAVAVWNVILGAIQGVWNWIAGNWPLILMILTGPIGIAVGIIVSHWDTIKGAFTAVKDWIAGRIDDIVSFFSGLPGRIGSGFGSIVSTITSPFRDAFNSIARLWNSTVGRLSFEIPGWVPGLGGHGFDVPDIPTFARGGVVSSPTLALVGDVPGGRREIISPEDLMRQVVREEMTAVGEVRTGGVNVGAIHISKGGPEEVRRELDWLIRKAS